MTNPQIHNYIRELMKEFNFEVEVVGKTGEPDQDPKYYMYHTITGKTAYIGRVKSYKDETVPETKRLNLLLQDVTEALKRIN